MPIIIGNNIEIHRMKKGLSLRDMSKKSGISVTAIHRVERNLSKPNPKTAYEICRALELPFEQVFIVNEGGAS